MLSNFYDIAAFIRQEQAVVVSLIIIVGLAINLLPLYLNKNT